jgi:hypothetical protein
VSEGGSVATLCRLHAAIVIKNKLFTGSCICARRWHLPDSRPRLQVCRIDCVLLYSAGRNAINIHPDRSPARSAAAKFGRQWLRNEEQRMVERMARHCRTSTR